MSMTTTTSGPSKTARPAARKVFGGLMGVMVALVMMGCPKPPPPPPPAPPPPPPPPPPPVSLESLGQDMKADARVTFASGLEVEQDQESLGRALVSLADALAKGDDTKLDTLLDAKARELLSELRNSGAWQDQTKQVESVRVVFLGGVNLGESAAARAAYATDPAAIRAELDAIGDKLPFDTAEKMKEWAEKLPTPEGRKEIADELQKTVEAMKASGSANEMQQKTFEEMIKMLRADAAPAGAEAGASIGALIAVQDPRGSYLTGWRAINVGDTWSFTGAPATPETRPRAEAFDGVGAQGFQGVVIVKKPADDKKPGDAGADGADGADGAPGADGDGGDSDKKDKPDDGDKKKNTPAGPVTIPGGG